MNESKKKIVLTEQATKFLLSLSPLAYADMLRAIELLSVNGRLAMPDAKKLDDNLFEIRVRSQNLQNRLQQNGWEKLTGRLAAMIAADPKIGRQSDLFAKRLRTRQAKAFARIEANPDSRAYRDYVLVPGRKNHA